MIKITPTVTACRVTIHLRPEATGSPAIIAYVRTSLGPQGDLYVESFTEDYFRRMMQEWEAQLNHYLSLQLRTRDGTNIAVRSPRDQSAR